jgi:small-conductance mechanosensitive channel
MALNLAQAEETAETSTQTGETATTQVDVACGNQGPFCDALLEWTGNEALAETVSYIVGTPLKIALIVAGALILNKVLRRVIQRSMHRIGTATAEHGEAVVAERNVDRAEERATTIASLLRSLSTATVYGIAAIMILSVIGISIVPVIASAGVLGLAIGFGAQSVVEDLLRGVFMLGEDQFGVGDRIDVGVVNGTVERVTLRTAVIRDADGTLWHVPNSEINRVANENQLASRASVEIGVSYDADLEKTMRVLQEAAQAAADEPEWKEHVTKAPEVQGVQELGDDAVTFRVLVWVAAGERRPFERLLRLKLKEALDQAELEMPNRQLDVWLRGQAKAA